MELMTKGPQPMQIGSSITEVRRLPTRESVDGAVEGESAALEDHQNR